ncbi:MAG TPA: hypothetical protein VHA30_04035 [Patescibacteria group bacterium]|nr:hypothetical protein [Patescibacteria group bacterium]
MSLLTDKIELEVQQAELGAQKALSGFPPAARWFLIIGLLAAVPVYFISRLAADSWWQKSLQSEIISAKPSFTNPQALKISDVSVVAQGNNSYAAAVQISNPNLDLSLDRVSYEFDFYNSQKQQVYSAPGQLYLPPDQSKYIIAPSFTSTDAVAYASFKLPDQLPWQKRLGIPQITLTAAAPSYYNQASPPAFVVAGSYYNNSPYILATVHLTFVLFDQNGKIVGVSQRSDSTVQPFERRAYQQLWPNLLAPAAGLGRVEVAAETDALDAANLSVPAAGTSSASDLGRPK